MAPDLGRQLLKQGEAAYAEGSFEAAKALFERAAEEGVLEALYYLGIIFKDGDGVPADGEVAKRFLNRFIRGIREQAAKGDAASQLRLGKMLQHGDQVLKDEREAKKWITAAAQGGYPPAQFHLSCLYSYGWCGLRSNPILADEWLAKAAEGGFPEAMYQKGIDAANLYLESKDADAYQNAIHWLERARDAGYREAEAALRSVAEGFQ